MADLPAGATVATGSPRRSVQLSLLRPDLAVTGIRGNVDTRLARVDAGDVDAVVLAEAGLRRLGRLDAVGHRFTVHEMVPAPAQGALAVEYVDGGRAASLLGALDDPATRRAVTVERAVLALTRLGCRGALGAHAAPMADGSVALTGFIDDGLGPRRATVVAADDEAPAALCLASRSSSRRWGRHDRPVADSGDHGCGLRRAARRSPRRLRPGAGDPPLYPHRARRP
jgi:hydroxymethylbilane synthase